MLASAEGKLLGEIGCKVWVVKAASGYPHLVGGRFGP